MDQFSSALSNTSKMRFFLVAILLSAIFVPSTVTGWVRVRRAVTAVRRVINIPCKVSTWLSWSGCSRSCGSGHRTRNRNVISAAVGGLCNFSLKDSTLCNTRPCPCKVGTWSTWSKCSRSCGSGLRTRNRHIVEHGGSCDYDLEGRESCNTQPCPCKVGTWSTWSSCSRSCGSGHRTRNRRIVQLAQNGGSCGYSLTSIVSCFKKPCPIPCKVGTWSTWSSCSRSCGSGLRRRNRRIIQLAQNGGSCGYSLTSSVSCTDKPCPVPCDVSEWSAWSRCSRSCGSGRRSRDRYVVQSAKHGGSCEDNLKESTSCNTRPCPVPCKVSTWSTWSNCTRSCGSGRRTRNRHIVESSQHGGSCDYNLEGNESCNTKPCPVPCKVSTWLTWSDCSRSCGSGLRTRNRHIVESSQHGGSCDYSLKGRELCNTKPCPVPVPCKVSTWSTWSNCTRSCGSGRRTRSRGIVEPAKNGGSCERHLEDSKPCEVGRLAHCQV